MIDATKSGFAPNNPWDRNFFLILLGLIWLGILMGFGGDIADHYQKHGLDYPLIVHIHAAAFVGWLVLFTVQILLIRAQNYELHKRLGLGMVGLAIAMVILGPATAIIVDGADYAKSGEAPTFLAIQFTDILDFAGLVTAALLLRKTSSAHKRLMLLATLYISDAGFARWLGEPLGKLLGEGPWQFWCQLYLANTLLMLALGAYDLITRKRLHPAYIAGMAWVIAMQITALVLYGSPWWAPLSLHFIGR